MNQQKTGKYIAEKRKSQNMTQTQLAERLGVSDKAVSKWERGISLPDVSKYQELCEVLEVSLNELFAGEDLRGDTLAVQSEKNLMEMLRREVTRRKQLLGAIIVAVICVAVLVAGYIANLNLVEKENDNRLGQLKYMITTSDERYTHYTPEGEPMVGVTVDGDDTFVSRKTYFHMDSMTKITVDMVQVSDHEDAVADDENKYRSSHEFPIGQLGDGVNRITCGILESGGAMAWIYTDCGIYIMRAESLRFDDSCCEEELHFFLSGISTDKSLENEIYE